LKSSNLLVGENYQTKVSDFGIARFKEERTMTMVGTGKNRLKFTVMAKQNAVKSIWLCILPSFHYNLTVILQHTYIIVQWTAPEVLQGKRYSSSIDT
jgi:serine/threonine protein kinase